MRKLLLTGLILVMTACFDYTSVTKIAEDGSGSISIQLEIPQIEDARMSMLEFKVNDSIQGWKTTLLTSDTLDTSIVYRLEGNFESPAVLARAFGLDTFVFEKKEVGEVIRCHLNMPPIYPPGTHLEGTFESTGDLIKALFKYGSDDCVLTEKFVLPGKIIEHNANMRTKDTLVWNVGAMELVKEEVALDAVWEVPR